MKIHIGTYFGTPLFLHWSWFLLLPFVIFSNGYLGLILTVAAFFFVTLHEYGHCLMAGHFNLEVKDVTLYPIGGLARMQLPINSPKEELLIALAGPFVNFVIALITIVACYFLTPAEFTTFTALWNEHPAYTILIFTCWINIIMAVFNMLPVFPMDGGRTLRACLVFILKDFITATLYAVRISQALCILFIIWGIYTENLLFVVIFMLMMLGAQNELVIARHYTNIHNMKWKVSLVLGRPELVTAPLSEVIVALEDVEDERIKELLQTDELLPILKDVEAHDKGR